MKSFEGQNTLHTRILKYAIGGDDVQKTRAINALIDEIRAPNTKKDSETSSSDIAVKDTRFLKALIKIDDDIQHYARLQASLATLDQARYQDLRVPREVSSMRRLVEKLLKQHQDTFDKGLNTNEHGSRIRGEFSSMFW